jgi:ABC-2 type transport system ATP-binding protein
MSVTVKGLTKLYGEQKAIDQVSFTAGKGEILGFLGPNGAGKTTTMKIITGFIPQTEGSAEVCGFDVSKSPLEVRQRIGYLPEHNPLYKDMYVKEFLEFVAGLHSLKQPLQRVKDMIGLTGLEKEQNKLIGALSKGYRQRVGLAQAMLHDPEVLILDEPTTGLDPNQLVEIRSLIKQLGKEKTLIFSTHIMQEVEAICKRVLIINNGKIVADNSIEELPNLIKGESMVSVAFLEEIKAELLKKIKGVHSVKKVGQGVWQLGSDAKADIRPEVFRFAVDQKLTLIEMHKEAYSVEDVFQKLTTKSK